MWKYVAALTLLVALSVPLRAGEMDREGPAQASPPAAVRVVPTDAAVSLPSATEMDKESMEQDWGRRGWGWGGGWGHRGWGGGWGGGWGVRAGWGWGGGWGGGWGWSQPVYVGWGGCYPSYGWGWGAPGCCCW